MLRFETVLAENPPDVTCLGMMPGRFACLLRVKGQETPVGLHDAWRHAEAFPDGFVRMDINPEISSLSARTTQISEDFQSPIITRRRAETTVTVHDGQTIVLGGLISDRFERRDRMVPFCGELPFVGPLFRSNNEETAKTEVLIVLTPHVIDSPADFARVDHITEREIERLTVPEEVKESIRRSLIDGTGALYDSKGNKIDVKLEEKE